MHLTWPQVLAWRVQQHHLDTLAPADKLLEVTQDLCGLHAQLMSSAELTLWARLQELDKNAVQQALWQDRTLVKAWAMRGTLHLLPSSEYSMWQAALSPLVKRSFRPAWLKWYGLTADEMQLVIDSIGHVLDGQLLTRTQLAEQVAKHTGSAKLREKITQSSWGSMLKPPTYSGNLCFAPSIGQNVRFTRPSSWLKKWQTHDPETAQLQVLRRYLHTYGPATSKEIGLWWGGNAEATARRLSKQLADELTTIDLEGRRAVLLTADLRAVKAATPNKTVRLLPAFDQYVVGAPRDADQVLPNQLRARVYRPQGWFSPVLLVDGRMCGVWRHTRRSSRVVVEIEAFEELPRWARRKTESEAERLAAFLQGSLELAWTRLGPNRGDMEQQPQE